MNINTINTRTWLNDNKAVIGSSGSGKTTSMILPYIASAENSFIVADTKGNLFNRCGEALKQRGFEICCLDLTDPSKSCGYDPLAYVGRTVRGGKEVFDEKDMISLAECLVPITSGNDPFWDYSARSVIAMLISFVLEEFDEEERNLCSVAEVFRCLISSRRSKQTGFLEEHCLMHPDSLASRRYRMLKGSMDAEKMWGSIEAFCANALSIFDFDGTRQMITRRSGFRIENIGRRKTAVFINVSDSDRSLDALVSTFYTQCFRVLIREADSQPDSRLRIPVHILLDDFATNCVISDFDNLISVIRSRGISATVILQSLSQLEAIYGKAKSSTILQNCDSCYYLGGCDLSTAEYIAKRVGKPFDRIMQMPLDKLYRIVRGEAPKLEDKVMPAEAFPAPRQGSEPKPFTPEPDKEITA